ncbi:MAG: arginine N-succinyltransferase, partial [Acidimicrobiia bacterium]|nr:arginine N-succinyltransferase [Acidimicrobiia bacterium]
MIIVRPVTAGDTDGLLALFERAGTALHGMSSLRADRDALAARAAHAEESFARTNSPDPSADYLFVLVDTDSDTIIGTGAVIASVGLVDAFYSYKIVTRIYSSRELGVYNKIPTLVLCNDYTGLTEVASLFVDAAYRSTRAGKLMALSRLLFITEHTELFTETIFA